MNGLASGSGVVGGGGGVGNGSSSIGIPNERTSSLQEGSTGSVPTATPTATFSSGIGAGTSIGGVGSSTGSNAGCGAAVPGTGSPIRGRGCPTGLPASMIAGGGGGDSMLRKSRSQGGKKLQKCLSTASYGEESSLTRPQMTPLSHNLLVTRQYCSFGSTTSNI